MRPDDIRSHAEEIVAENSYLILSTVDDQGRPWTTPVFFAAQQLGEFFWISDIDARHTRNLLVRPQVSLVIFDSTVTPGEGRALYAVGTAAEVPADDLEPALRVYPGPARRGVRSFHANELSEPASWRLYRAVATGTWVLCPRGDGRACALHGRVGDHRQQVG
jgi:hypothetical protein